jgi:hypothetical protein
MFVSLINVVDSAWGLCTNKWNQYYLIPQEKKQTRDRIAGFNNLGFKTNGLKSLCTLNRLDWMTILVVFVLVASFSFGTPDCSMNYEGYQCCCRVGYTKGYWRYFSLTVSKNIKWWFFVKKTDSHRKTKSMFEFELPGFQVVLHYVILTVRASFPE